MRSLLAVDTGDPDHDRRASTLAAIVLLAIPASLVTAVVVYPFPNGPVSSASFLAAVALLAIVLGLSHAGHIDAAVVLFAVGLWSVTVAQPLLTGDLSTNVVIIPVACVMMIYVIPPHRLWWLFVWVISALIVLRVGTNDVDTVPQTRFSWLFNTAIAAALTIAVVTYGARQTADAIGKERRLSRELTAREATMLRLEEMANTDPLTGFLNRRSLDRDFRQVPVGAAALLDLDHFKEVNDEFSHAAGDRLLSGFAALVADAARPDDLLYRIGGDEFLVLRRGATPGGLGAWLHDVRERVRHGGWGDLHGLPMTFSGGVVGLDGQGLDPTLERADRAMYAAKQAGRDAIVVID